MPVLGGVHDNFPGLHRVKVAFGVTKFREGFIVGAKGVDIADAIKRPRLAGGAYVPQFGTRLGCF